MGGGEQAKYLQKMEVYNLIAHGREAEIPPIGEAAVPALVKVVEERPYWQKVMAAKLLGQIGGQNAVRALKGMLEHPEAGVRAEAVKALGGKDARGVNALLRRVAEGDQVWNVRKEAENALRRMSMVPVPPVENGNLRLRPRRGNPGKRRTGNGERAEKTAAKEAY
jgi:hypothetical protein